MTVWDRQAETCCQYLKKGRAVHVEGFLKMDTWEDKNTGEKRSKVKVQADRVQFLDRKDDGPGGGGPMEPDDEYAPRPEPRRPSAPRATRQRQRPGPGRLQQRPAGPPPGPPAAGRLR